MNTTAKYAFSSTLDRGEWGNSEIVSGDGAKAVAESKQQGDRDLVQRRKLTPTASAPAAALAQRKPGRERRGMCDSNNDLVGFDRE
jgi:hypothetical protein